MKIDPSKAFDECEDFLLTVIEGLIVAATMTLFNMSDADDTPDNMPTQSWLQTDEERAAMLSAITDEIYDKFVKSTYNRREGGAINKDMIVEYNRSLLSIGLFYMEFRDGIKEGDGQRVFRCWQYLLPIFFNTNRTNYAREAVILISQHKYLLTERQSAQLLYGRFINTQGIIGRNIPCDLHLEHLNKVCKACIRDLGANKKESNITKVAKCIGTIDSILTKFDSENNISVGHGSHARVSVSADAKMIAEHLIDYNAFVCEESCQKRRYSTFKNPKDLFSHDYEDDLLHFIKQNSFFR